MKITDDLQAKLSAPERSSTRVKESDAAFSRVLSEAASKGAGASASPSAPEGPSSLTGAGPAENISSAGKAEAFGQIEKTLGLLDQYTGALSDPNQSLKQVSNLIDNLEEEAGNLLRIGQGLPDGHEIKDLINRAAILTAVEAAKFRRGDYL